MKLELLTDIDMLEKGIRGAICNSFNRYNKLITNIWKIKIKIKNCHILHIEM